MAIRLLSSEIGLMRKEMKLLSVHLHERETLTADDIERRLKLFLGLMGTIWWTATKAVLMVAVHKTWEWGIAVGLGWGAKLLLWPYLSPALRNLVGQ